MMGVVTALYWPAGIVFAVVWLGALFGTKWSSVGGMAAAVSAPVAMWCFGRIDLVPVALALALIVLWRHRENRSEEHTSELQSLMRISYAVFCLKQKNKSHRYDTLRTAYTHLAHVY